MGTARSSLSRRDSHPATPTDRLITHCASARSVGCRPCPLAQPRRRRRPLSQMPAWPTSSPRHLLSVIVRQKHLHRRMAVRRGTRDHGRRTPWPKDPLSGSGPVVCILQVRLVQRGPGPSARLLAGRALTTGLLGTFGPARRRSQEPVTFAANRSATAGARLPVATKEETR
jgi:hypothetical protein